MPKAMLFIDGTWLYANVPSLGTAYGKPDFHLDYGILPRLLAEEVEREMGSADVDVVRTHLFGSYASNYHLDDDDLVQRRLDFYRMLREEHRYELETFPVNFCGRRVRRVDRDPDDEFEPKEKSVDICLASALLYYAAIPNAYDIAITVVGDRDFVPALQYARRLGKRVAVASIKGACASEYADPQDASRLRDFDVIWLNDHLNRLELKFDPQQRECESPYHQGSRLVWTTFRPRKGQRFYCDDCRRRFAEQKQEQMHEFVSQSARRDEGEGEPDIGSAVSSNAFTGQIKNKLEEKGYGFIRASNGQDYFFHLTDLFGDLTFDQVDVGDEVTFHIKRGPSADRAGAAQEVRLASPG